MRSGSSARSRLVRVRRTCSTWSPGAGCPAPLVRTARVGGRTYSTEAPGHVSTQLVAIAPRRGGVSVERLRLLDDLWCQGAWVGTAGRRYHFNGQCGRCQCHARPRSARRVPAPCSSCPAPKDVEYGAQWAGAQTATGRTLQPGSLTAGSTRFCRGRAHPNSSTVTKSRTESR